MSFCGHLFPPVGGIRRESLRNRSCGTDDRPAVPFLGISLPFYHASPKGAIALKTSFQTGLIRRLACARFLTSPSGRAHNPGFFSANPSSPSDTPPDTAGNAVYKVPCRPQTVSAAVFHSFATSGISPLSRSLIYQQPFRNGVGKRQLADARHAVRNIYAGQMAAVEKCSCSNAFQTLRKHDIC